MAFKKEIIHVLNRLDIAGGAEMLAFEIARKEGHKIFFHESKISNVYETKGVDLVAYRFTAFLLFYIIFKRNVIWHFHLFPGTWISLFSKRCIIHEHNTWNNRRKYILLRFLERRIYASADLILCISPAVKKSLKSWLGPKKSINIQVLDNFVPEIKHEQSNIKKNNFLLFPGSLSPQKNHLYFLEQWSKSNVKNDYNLVIAGSGSLRDLIVEKIKKLNINKNVYMVGLTPLGDLYRECVAVVLPSQWEGFGLVAVEAARHHKFTIGTDVPGLNQLLHPKLKLPIYFSEKDLDKIIIQSQNIKDYKFLDSLCERYSYSKFIKKYNKYIYDNFG